jgi:peptide-methionine (R)-S-oxide reductase
MDIDDNLPKTDEEWRSKLDPHRYEVTRQGGTEAPFSNEYYNETAKGMYKCFNCGLPLFSSDTKYETKIPGLMGWPSFEDAIPGSVKFQPDDTLGMHRTEVVCSRCGSHLGHVFDDDGAESKTGKHYCVNSCSLKLEKSE